MSQRRIFPLAVVVAIAAAIASVVAAAVGGDSRAAPAQGATRVAVVTDIGGVNDRSFNFLANQGRLRAQNRLNAQTRIFITNTASERLPNLRAAAQQRYNLVIGVGFLMYDPLGKVAPAFRNTKFAGVDVPISLVEGTPRNIRGLIFREQEAGYLVGYLAGLTVRRERGRDVIAAVGANRVPAIVRFIGGYRAGAKRANPRVRVLVNYANDPTFSDQAKCKETALNQIARGARVVFQVAGGCGLGALSAARERRVWGIGVDADQYYLGRHMLTSAVKKVDVAVYQTIAEFRRNPARFRTGFDKVFTVRNGGVGYGRISNRVPRADVRRLQRIRRLIARGTIRPPAR